MGPTPWAIMDKFTLEAQEISIAPELQLILSSVMDTPLLENGKSQLPPLLELEELELLELELDEEELEELEEDDEPPPTISPNPIEPLQ